MNTPPPMRDSLGYPVDIFRGQDVDLSFGAPDSVFSAVGGGASQEPARNASIRRVTQMWVMMFLPTRLLFSIFGGWETPTYPN